MLKPSECSATDKFYRISDSEFENLDQMNLIRPFIDEDLRDLPLAMLKGLYRNTFYHQMFSEGVARFGLQVLIGELDKAEVGDLNSRFIVSAFGKSYSREKQTSEFVFGEAGFLAMDRFADYVKFESKNKDLFDIITNHLYFQSIEDEEEVHSFLEGAKIFEICLSYEHRLGMSWNDRVTPEGEKIQAGEFSSKIYREGISPYLECMGFDDNFDSYDIYGEGAAALAKYADGAFPWEDSMESE